MSSESQPGVSDANLPKGRFFFAWCSLVQIGDLRLKRKITFSTYSPASYIQRYERFDRSCRMAGNHLVRQHHAGVIDFTALLCLVSVLDRLRAGKGLLAEPDAG